MRFRRPNLVLVQPPKSHKPPKEDYSDFRVHIMMIQCGSLVPSNIENEGWAWGRGYSVAWRITLYRIKLCTCTWAIYEYYVNQGK